MAIPVFFWDTLSWIYDTYFSVLTQNKYFFVSEKCRFKPDIRTFGFMLSINAENCFQLLLCNKFCKCMYVNN